MDEMLNQWFIREIIAHEVALMRFLVRVWPDRSEVDDLRQEIYIRIYEAAAKARPLSPRAFLFATARHLMADRVRRSRIISIEMKGDLDSLNVLIDEISPEQRIGARQELWRLTHAFELLPPACRDVMWMRKVQELSQKEVAERLGISEKTVEKRVARGVHLLADVFYGDKGTSKPQRGMTFNRSESEHG